MKKRYFLISILLLICISILSLLIGSKILPMSTFFEVDSYNRILLNLRVPRMVFGLIAGCALAISGCLMQSITRNPIADPSIIGVNTGASLFVVILMAFFNVTSPLIYIIAAFFGGIITSVFVYLLASSHGKVSPLKLALSGAAISTSLHSLINTIMLPSSSVMDKFRFWQNGSISKASIEDIYIILPFIIIALMITIFLIPSLNILALGDEQATTLGVNVNKIRLLGAISSVLLTSSVTAIGGPIGFIGLVIPHFVKNFISKDYKYCILFSGLFGSILLLLSDIIGRVIANPGEIEVGIIMAIIGVPIFIQIVRKVKMNG